LLAKYELAETAAANRYLANQERALSLGLLLSLRRVTTLSPPMFHRVDGADGRPAYHGEVLREQEPAEW
jgi:hypothetical protein